MRIAALRCEFTPLAYAIDFSSKLSPAQLKDVLAQSRLSDQVKEYLLQTAERRTQRARN